MRDVAEFIVAYLAKHGPATAPVMAEGGPGFTSAAVRQTAARMADRGELVRAGTRPATNARGDAVGGPRAVLWALPVDASDVGEASRAR